MDTDNVPDTALKTDDYVRVNIPVYGYSHEFGGLVYISTNYVFLKKDDLYSNHQIHPIKK